MLKNLSGWFLIEAYNETFPPQSRTIVGVLLGAINQNLFKEEFIAFSGQPTQVHSISWIIILTGNSFPMGTTWAVPIGHTLAHTSLPCSHSLLPEFQIRFRFSGFDAIAPQIQFL